MQSNFIINYNKMQKEIKTISELYRQPTKLADIGLTKEFLKTLKKRKAQVEHTVEYSLPLDTVINKRGSVYNYCLQNLEHAKDVLRYAIGIDSGAVNEVVFYLYQGKFN